MFQCLSCDEKKALPVFCDNKFCEVPGCVSHRKSKIRDMVGALARFRFRCDGHAKQIVLNFPNVDPKKFSKDDLAGWNRKAAKFIHVLQKKYSLLGAIRCIEISQGNQDGAVNMHYHILADMPYIPQKILMGLWESIAGGRYSCRINGYRGSIAHYVVKYVTKPAFDLPGDVKFGLYKAFFKARMYTRYGSMISLDVESCFVFCCEFCGGELVYAYTSSSFDPSACCLPPPT